MAVDAEIGSEENSDEGEDGAQCAPKQARVGKLDAVFVEKTVRTNFWWCFGEMLNFLHSVLGDFQEWCGSCYCHVPLKKLDRMEAAQFLKRQRDANAEVAFDGPFFCCPMAGLRAPELAAGAWRDIMDQLVASRLESLLAPMLAESLAHLKMFCLIWKKGRNESSQLWNSSCDSGQWCRGNWQVWRTMTQKWREGSEGRLCSFGKAWMQERWTSNIV